MQLTQCDKTHNQRKFTCKLHIKNLKLIKMHSLWTA